MRISCSNDKKIFTEHKEGIPHLSACMLDSLGVPNLFSTRFMSWDEEKGEGKEGLRTSLMKWDDISEAAPVIQEYRDRLARQLGSSMVKLNNLHWRIKLKLINGRRVGCKLRRTLFAKSGA